jgi:hypothetical protein
MFVVNFNGKVTMGLPYAVGFTDNSAELERAIFRTAAGGMAALYEAVAVLRRLAGATGGDVFLPRKPEDVVAICERIARDIRRQYTLGYASSNAKPGIYRSIRVAARAAGNGKLVARTRSGYIAGKAEK